MADPSYRGNFKNIMIRAYASYSLNNGLNENVLPTDILLKQNYPNPFNPSTSINYSITQNSDVRLVIFDMLGNEISTLINKKLSPGNYTAIWDGRNYQGNNVTSGIYFYTLITDDYKETKKMILFR